MNLNPMIYLGAVFAVWKTLASRIIMMKRFRFSKVFCVRRTGNDICQWGVNIHGFDQKNGLSLARIKLLHALVRFLKASGFALIIGFMLDPVAILPTSCIARLDD